MRTVLVTSVFLSFLLPPCCFVRPFVSLDTHMPWYSVRYHLRSMLSLLLGSPDDLFVSHCCRPGSMCCILLMAACEFTEMCTLIQCSSDWCLLSFLSLRPFRSSISRASPIAYSFASNNSLLVPRYVLFVVHSGLRHATLAHVCPVSFLQPSVLKDISSCPSVCLLASYAPPSLVLVKEAMLPGNVS